MTQRRTGHARGGGPATPRRTSSASRAASRHRTKPHTRLEYIVNRSMRVSSMCIRLCVLVVFITSVCQGAAVPAQRLDCVTNAHYNDLIEAGYYSRISPEPCATGHQFSERRKRQAEAVQQVDVQPADTSTSTQPTSTEAQPQVENSTSAVLTSSSAAVSSPEVIPSLPPPPHPSAAQATAVKPRSCKSGSTWEEECNTCWCLDNGMAACTVKRCEVASPVKATKPTTAGSPIETTQPAPTSPTSTPSVQSSTPSSSSVQESSISPTTPVQSSTSSSGGTS